MSEHEPRRRKPAGNPLPPHSGDLDERYSLPPAAVPSPPQLPELPPSMTWGTGDALPPGYPPLPPSDSAMPPGLPPDMLPPSISDSPTQNTSAHRMPTASGVPRTPSAPAKPAPRPAASKAASATRKAPAKPDPDAPAAPRSHGPAPTRSVSAQTAPNEQASPDSWVSSVDVSRVATRFAPPWLVSMFVHLFLLIVLALVQFGDSIKQVLLIEASYAESLGDQMLDDTVVTTVMEMTDDLEQAFSLDVNPAENPLAAMPQLDIVLDTPGPTLNLNAPSIGMALSGREKGAKQALLTAYGGNATTEDAVAMALEWLRKNQRRDGSWSLTGPFSDGVTVDNRTAATAMAMLAFQGSGETHVNKGKHHDVVVKGLEALLKMQDRDGNFVHDGISGHRLYAQAMASIAVCEMYGMTKDPKLKEPAERALAYAARIQADDGQGGGGWRYHPGQDVDTSVTGWFVMAYQSGRMAGLDSHSQTLQRVSTYLDHVEKVEMDSTVIKDISYFYRIDEEPKLSMTAEALLCRQYQGWDRHEPRLVAGVKKILLPENRINWDEPNFYYWYYATQVMHHMGGNEWHQWNQVMREVLPKAQEKSGKEKGSWSPAGDPYGYQGGRLYSTCFCTFMLESYYRHLPIYRHGG